jgi:hypothetical protein
LGEVLNAGSLPFRRLSNTTIEPKNGNRPRICQARNKYGCDTRFGNAAATCAKSCPVMFSFQRSYTGMVAGHF